eukprot:1158360-Pelagomonas_calceolata.AAC.5
MQKAHIDNNIREDWASRFLRVEAHVKNKTVEDQKQSSIRWDERCTSGLETNPSMDFRLGKPRESGKEVVRPSWVGHTVQNARKVFSC